MSLPLTFNHNIHRRLLQDTDLCSRVIFWFCFIHLLPRFILQKRDRNNMYAYTYTHCIIYKRTQRWFTTQIAVINEINDFLSGFEISNPTVKCEYFGVLTENVCDHRYQYKQQLYIALVVLNRLKNLLILTFIIIHFKLKRL